MLNVELKNTSYQLASGEWTPRILKRTYKSEGVEEIDYSWDKLPTKKEADSFAEGKIAEMQKDL